ncbi:uncharacterized protein LOC124144664 [Haliotis rufescens]|uniref:uncharacterized protein LOC124144664 n=1 Tax=Haliotis rufescens TaxID=6454 RepID=UPI001EB092CA|nr:uncharacterized protein LOC124144664 [Haliotis rufescens]
MSPVLLLGIVLCVSPSFAQNYDQIWQDMLMGGSAPLNPTQILSYFRAMMRPAPAPEDPTVTTRVDFKFFWREAYTETERIADGLFSFFDGQKDEIFDGNDLLPLMNIGDRDGDGALNRTEFDSYMDLAYQYAGNQRLFPSNAHHAAGQAHQHGNNHHLHHLHQGKPFFG